MLLFCAIEVFMLRILEQIHVHIIVLALSEVAAKTGTTKEEATTTEAAAAAEATETPEAARRPCLSSGCPGCRD